MRPLIATACVSLDGVMEAPGGNRATAWTFRGIEFDEAAYELHNAMPKYVVSTTQRNPEAGLRRHPLTRSHRGRACARGCPRIAARTQAMEVLG